MTPPSSPESFCWDPPRDTTYDDIEPRLMCAFAQDGAVPVLTIAIPTFQRGSLLLETVRTVLAQTVRECVELIVIDNDPASTGHEALLAAEPSLRTTAFRYYRNPVNVGMFGNWNMGIGQARGKFISILNDDDLLHPDFVQAVLPVIRDDASVEAVVCSKRELDFRSGTPVLLQASMPTRIIHAFIRFGIGNRRVMRLRDLFFANVVGNSLGMIFRAETARAIGGFHPAEFPSADYYFFARLARRGRLIQLKRILAYVGVGENDSAKPSTILGFLHQRYLLQQALLDGHTPGWWRHLRGSAARIDLEHHRRMWKMDLTVAEAEARLGIPMPARFGRFTRFVQLLSRAI